VRLNDLCPPIGVGYLRVSQFDDASNAGSVSSLGKLELETCVRQSIVGGSNAGLGRSYG
jgi:hypothetical protein